jgi:hypothetical protein
MTVEELKDAVESYRQRLKEKSRSVVTLCEIIGVASRPAYLLVK